MGKTGGSTMTLNLSISEKEDLKPRITVFRRWRSRWECSQQHD